MGRTGGRGRGPIRQLTGGVFGVALLAMAAPSAGQELLVPMDRDQTNHLKAYGLTFWVLEEGQTAEWLLNYRGGAFLLPDSERVRAQAALRGVRTEPVDAASVARIRGRMEEGNMEAVPLEKPPKIAVYTPPNSTPWDDAVTMALEYAEIPYDKIWDRDVLTDGLGEWDWVHLHHEDFTGQYSKFYLSYAGSDWLREEVARNTEMAQELGYVSVPAMKKAVASSIRDYVEGGGFLFAMCSATETIEIALAAGQVDIAAAFSDGSPPNPRANQELDWSGSMAFEGAEIQISPTVNAFSDIDAHQVNTPWRKELGVYTLFEFSAEFDPVPAMLTQNHEGVIEDFYGLTTAFQESVLKPGVVVLARESSWAKYIHGAWGEGTFTYFGGHDPEDAEHQIGDPPTDLDLHPNSPGYRLILNNVLFPAAKKQKLKT